MKLRSDFVTNSSSSSFIIGKREDNNVTIEMVYQQIKNFYKEYLDQLNLLIDYVRHHPEFNLEYKLSESGNYRTFVYTGKGSRWSNKNFKMELELEKIFGISTLENFAPSYEWLKCETYRDYERYWIKKMHAPAEHTHLLHAPFTITDFIETKAVKWLHYDCPEEYMDEYRIDSESDILAWYCESAKCIFEHADCSSCDERGWCDRDKHDKLKIKIQTENIPEENACLWLLGRVCVHSECGYIPDYVVERLSNISEFSCNHMG